MLFLSLTKVSVSFEKTRLVETVCKGCMQQVSPVVTVWQYSLVLSAFKIMR